jgi:hypothetical protein
MSNRRRPRAIRKPSADEASWWRSTGIRLGCRVCATAPLCDDCGRRRAVTVAAFGIGTGVDMLAGHHHHLCGPCRDAAHRRSGLDRHELG